jgi:hypothetical protein
MQAITSVFEKTLPPTHFCLVRTMNPATLASVAHSSREKTKPSASGISARAAMSFLCVLVVVCGLLASSDKANAGPEEFAPVKILGKRGMIVPEMFLVESGLSNEGFWTPTTKQIKEAELALPTFLRNELQARPTIKELSALLSLAPKSRRQYIGIISNGRKVIWINCIPQKPRKASDPFANWKHEIIDVSDGGPGFWGVFYDLEKHSFDKLVVNGSA